MRVLPAAQHPRRDGKDPPLAAPQIWLAVSRILVAIMVAISPPIGSYQSSVSKKHRTHSAPDGRALGPSFKSPTAVMPTGRTCAAHNYDRMPDDPCSPCTRVPMSNPRLRSSGSVTWMGRGFLFVVTSPLRHETLMNSSPSSSPTPSKSSPSSSPLSSPPPPSRRCRHSLIAATTISLQSPSPRHFSPVASAAALVARRGRLLLTNSRQPSPLATAAVCSPLSRRRRRLLATRCHHPSLAMPNATRDVARRSKD